MKNIAQSHNKIQKLIRYLTDLKEDEKAGAESSYANFAAYASANALNRRNVSTMSDGYQKADRCA
jgi:hypothetical protein